MKGDSEAMVGARSANQSPQSVGSSGVDSGVDSLPEQTGDLTHVAISLCGGLTDNREITAGRSRMHVQNFSWKKCRFPHASRVCVPHHRAVPGESGVLPPVL